MFRSRRCGGQASDRWEHLCLHSCQLDLRVAQEALGTCQSLDGIDEAAVGTFTLREWGGETVCAAFGSTETPLSNFLGDHANAVRWQVYTTLLVYVLLRFQGFLSAWAHRFTRLFAVVRSAVWERLDLFERLKSYGTASGRIRFIGARPEARTLAALARWNGPARKSCNYLPSNFVDLSP
jgi:hypothetical protein